MWDIFWGSDESLEYLAGIMRRSIIGLVWPYQCLLVGMFLLGKKHGGSRTIGLMGSFMRVVMAHLSDTMRAWDVAVARPDDTALVGRNAEVSVAGRHLEIELDTELGRSSALILWDGKEFYDRLDSQVVVSCAQAESFPPVALALAFACHRMPRVLTAQGAAGPIIPGTGRSLVPGCTSSTSLARGVVKSPILEVERGLSRVEKRCSGFYQHVDDITERHVSGTESGLVSLTARVGASLGKALQRHGITISPKTVVVASKPGLAKAIAGKLTQRLKVAIGFAGSAEDLGGETSAGRRRVMKTLKGRVAKGDRRSWRIAVITKQHTPAAGLYTTGARPQSSYGLFLMGASPVWVGRHRAMAARAAAVPGRATCVASVIWWRLGPSRDPYVWICVQQIRFFLQVWSSTLPARRRSHLAQIWPRVAAGVVAGSITWAHGKGLLHATILTLYQLGFDVTKFLAWKAPGGKVFNPVRVASGNHGPLLQRVAEIATEQVWLRAGLHLFGRGLDGSPPSFEPARRARAELVKAGKETAVRALDLVVCGGAWGRTPARICRCGLHDVSEWHWYWGCPMLQASDLPEVQESQHIADLIYKDPDLRYAECLYARGLVPASVYSTDRVDPEEAWMSPSLPTQVKCQGLAYPDGSGGPGWVPKQCAQAGSGLAVLVPEVGPEGVAGFASVAFGGAGVPGRQTVPRAELGAIKLAASLASPGQGLTVFPDATYTSRGLALDDRAARLAKLSKGTNGDLWTELVDTLTEQHLDVRANKVRAHARPVRGSSWVSSS